MITYGTVEHIDREARGGNPMISHVTATRIDCDKVVDGQPCGSQLLIDNPAFTAEQIRAAAAERGWQVLGVVPEALALCPKHQER